MSQPMPKHDARVLAAMRRIGKPATASTIAHAARLPLHDTIDALNQLIAAGLISKSMIGWGRVFYHPK